MHRHSTRGFTLVEVLVALGILPVEVLGTDNAWADITPASDVEISIAFDAENAEPNMPLKIVLTINGQVRHLDGKLKAITASEIRQLRLGTLFDLCLHKALSA